MEVNLTGVSLIVTCGVSKGVEEQHLRMQEGCPKDPWMVEVPAE